MALSSTRSFRIEGDAVGRTAMALYVQPLAKVNDRKRNRTGLRRDRTSVAMAQTASEGIRYENEGTRKQPFASIGAGFAEDFVFPARKEPIQTAEKTSTGTVASCLLKGRPLGLPHPCSRGHAMTTQTTLSPKLPEKTEAKSSAATPPPPPHIAPVVPAQAYWGDRWTLLFWLFCFALMAGMNLFEAIHRFVRYLVENSPCP